MFIQEYVRMSRFIHIGSITSIIMIRCAAMPFRLIRYANGYEITSVITVAMKEYSKEIKKISLYSASCRMFASVKLPSVSVKAYPTTMASGMRIKSAAHRMYGAPAICWASVRFFICIAASHSSSSSSMTLRVSISSLYEL